MTESTPTVDPAAALARFETVRRRSLDLCSTLERDDFCLQSMPDASPPKWHLAHTTWFFETFVLKPFGADHPAPSPAFEHLFNSYYNGVCEAFSRPQRGLLTRPVLDEVWRYRALVDEAMPALFATLEGEELGRAAALVELGAHHEEQHQELLLTDTLHGFAQNPLQPALRPDARPPAGSAGPLTWHEMPERVLAVGHRGEGFHYDNEAPRHRTLVPTHALASRLATNGEFRAFIEDGGYRRPELWLSAGWAWVNEHALEAPLYWRRDGGGWTRFRLDGRHRVVDDAPVTHLSFFEADAFARWSDARLPTEFEWEAHAAERAVEGNLLDDAAYGPQAGEGQWFGDCWEWTSSSYAPYPGYRAAPGAIGEYNGKFMCDQYVLRGGSFATGRDHVRATYRNFFPTHARWQFAGVRLAKDLDATPEA